MLEKGIVLKACSLGEAARITGIETAPGEIFCSRDIAEAIRRLVRLRGAVPREFIFSWLHNMSAVLEADVSSLRRELSHVLDQMVLAGEVAPLVCGGNDTIAARPTRAVSVSSDLCAFLGVDPISSNMRWVNQGDPAAIVRHIEPVDDAFSLIAELGPPTYHNSLAKLGLAHGPSVTLSQFAALIIHKIIEESVNCEPASVIVLGRLPGDGSYGFGYVDAGDRKKPCALRIFGDGQMGLLILPDTETLSWLACVGKNFADKKFTWRNPGISPPQQLSRALSLAAKSVSPVEWLMNSEEINDWIGGESLELDGTAQHSDPDQTDVIESKSDARLLVEAGPGSGKTWVACRRIANLIDNGIPASRIVIISFTQAAVGELRDRISSFLSEPGLALQITIWTLDSFAWRIKSGSSAERTDLHNTDYEAGIEAAIKSLALSDIALDEYLGDISHLIVDEAQDLVGNRRLLLLRILATLRSTCGVTVFQDSAQAIYSWNETDKKNSIRQALVSDNAFTEIRLSADHRTRNSSLKALFSEARALLLDGCHAEPEKCYLSVRELIERHADGTLPFIREQDFSAASTLILFRTRGQLLTAASDLWSMGIEFGIRLSGRRSSILPWIGELFSNFNRDSISHTEFDMLWENIWPRPSGTDRELAWRSLWSVASSGPVLLDVSKLRERLSSGNIPQKLAEPVFDRKRIVLSTIHGAKGREADHVRLMMPRIPGGGETTRWDEEARILFVGATRARKSLRIGSAQNILSKRLGGKRRWQSFQHRGGSNAARVEFGIDGDVNEMAQVSPAPWDEAADAVEAQKRLWVLSDKITKLVAKRTRSEKYYALWEEGKTDGPMLGVLHDKVSRDLWAIGQEGFGAGAYPSQTIKGLFLIGVRTFVGQNLMGSDLEILEPYRHSGLWLVPVVAGVAPVFYNARRSSA